MNQSLHAAYAAHQQTSENIRDTEARALLNCASKLEEARKPGTSREDFGNAIRHNQKLWTFFQVCLCEEDNPLPKDLKILLLNLSRYVDKTSFRAVTDNNPDLLRSLININRTIAAGLNKNNTPETTETTNAPITPPMAAGSVMTSA